MNHLKPRIAPWLPILLVTILSLALFLLPTQGVSFQTVVNDSIFYEKCWVRRSWPSDWRTAGGSSW